MRRSGTRADQIVDAQKLADMAQRLDRLAREKAGGFQGGSMIQPVATLNPGDFSIEELIENPGKPLFIARQSEPRAAEIEAHLLTRHQHPAGVWGQIGLSFGALRTHANESTAADRCIQTAHA